MENGRLEFITLLQEGIFPVPVLGMADPRTCEVLGQIIFVRKRKLMRRKNTLLGAF